MSGRTVTSSQPAANLGRAGFSRRRAALWGRLSICGGLAIRLSKASRRPLILAVCALSAFAQAQPPITPDVLITTTFVTPLTYEAALERLDAYYDEQVGRRQAVAFPEIAPYRHFDIWHEMWALFDTSGNHARITLKKPSEAGAASVAKSWMLDLAGRLNADLPLAFKEEPGVRTVQSEIYSSRKDLARVLAAQPGLRSLVSWRHSGLFVSAEPLTQIALSTSGLRGARRLTVTAVDLPSAKSLMAKLQQEAAVPGICGAF